NDPMWNSYLDFSPKTFLTPTYWSEVMLKEIKGADFLEDVGRLWKDIEVQSSVILQKRMGSMEIEFDPLAALIKFTWAWHFVVSRIWKRKNEAVMIPWHLEKPKAKAKERAAQSIKSGEQVDITYREILNYKTWVW
ncbi:hypothetical protein HDU80_000897, partial [Chytriomyces hyalinus]